MPSFLVVDSLLPRETHSSLISLHLYCYDVKRGGDRGGGVT